MKFTRIEFTNSPRKGAKRYPGAVPARLTVALRRYSCGSTVGHGFYRRFLNEDPVGSVCHVTGWFEDGSLTVNLPIGGCSRLGRGDVEITSWPAYVTAEQRAEWDALPRISRADLPGYHDDPARDLR